MADAQLGSWGPDRRLQLVATTDPARLPGHSTWYLLTNLPRPAGGRTQVADLADIVRLYGLRNWVEQGYKQVKGERFEADESDLTTATASGLRPAPPASSRNRT